MSPRALLLAVLGGCTADLTTPDAVASALPAGWAGELAADPASFATLVADDRDAWIAWHGGDPQTASRSSAAVGPLALAEVHAVEAALAQACHAAWQGLSTRWTASGEHAALTRLTQLSSPGALPPLPDGATPAEASCHAEHRAARQGGPPPKCPAPLVAAADGGQAWPDPMVHATRAARSAVPAPSAPLALTAAWTAADAGDPLRGPSLAAAGVDLTPGDADTPERARAAVAALDAALESWDAAQRERVSVDGAGLLDDLSMAAVWRSRVLGAAARAHLDAGQPRSAAALLDLARDLRSPRAVGPVNRPPLFALSAWADLETGRSREALDALAPLRADWPHVEGCVSLVEDLVVLEGMARAGDSRER